MSAALCLHRILFCVFSKRIFRVGVQEVLSDDCFKISSQLANEVLLTAEAVEKWCKEVENVAEA